MSKEKVINISILVAAIGYVLFSFATIIIFQVPWRDEVIFADIAHSLLTKHDLTNTIARYRVSRASTYSYGPVFFVLQAGIMKILGFGMWQFRLLPILSGLAIFGLGVGFVIKKTASRLCALQFMLFFIFDRTINFYMHGARMDMTATAFVFGSILLFSRSLKLEQSTKAVFTAFVAGILLASGLLTTLRLGIAVVPCLLLFLLFKPESFKQYFYLLSIYGGIAVIAVVSWLYYGFGGVNDAAEVVQSSHKFSGHFGFMDSILRNLYRRGYEAPKMLFFYLSVLYLFIKKPNIIRKDFVFCMLLCIVLGFVLFIKEFGGYRSNIMPYIYIVMIVAVHSMQRHSIGKAGQLVLLALIGINLISYTPRLIYIARTIHQGGGLSDDMLEQIESKIPVGSNVVIEDKYYYLLRETDRNLLIPHLNPDFYQKVSNFTLSPDGFSATHILGDSSLKMFPKKQIFQFTGFLGKKPEPINKMLKRFLNLEYGIIDSDYYDPVYKIIKEQLPFNKTNGGL